MSGAIEPGSEEAPVPEEPERPAWHPVRGALDLMISTGPILRREFVALLRSPKVWWLAVLTVVASGAIPVIHWPAENAPSPEAVAEKAFAICRAIAYAALFLCVPAVAAGAIAGERERGTYELLLATRLGADGILLGKTIANVLLFLLLLALSFPAVSLLFFLGGNLWSRYVGDLFQQMAFAVIIAALGILTSALNRRAARAYIMTFLSAIALCAVSAIFTILAPVVFLLGLCLIVSLGREAAAYAGPATPSMPADPAREGLGAARSYVARRALRESAEGIADDRNPVRIASLRNDAAGSAAAGRALFWGPAGILFLHFAFRGHDDPLSSRAALAVNGIILIGILAAALPALAVFALLGERDEERLDLLRGTFLGPREILGGKLAAIRAGGWPLPLLGLLSAACFLPFVFHVDDDLAEALPILARLLSFSILAACAFFAWPASGLLAAAWTRRMGPALALGAAVNLVLLAAPLYFLGTRPLISPLLAAPVGAGWLLLGAAQLALAGAVFRRKWMRD